MKEIREYKGRRPSKRPPISSKSNYFKKLLKQSFVSILIFAVILSNNFLKTDFAAKIQTFAKAALEYEIDLTVVSDSIKTFFKSSIPASSQGEVENENPTNSPKNL